MSNLEQAIDSLGATANRIADERNKFKAQRDALLAAAKGVWKLLEDGTLVRQTNNDHEPGWAIKQIPMVRALAALEQAISACEE